MLATFILPQAAQAIEFREGQYLMVAKSYDETRNRFSTNVPQGEREACFQVSAFSETEIELRHISGPYRPWWSDDTYAPGTYHDTWFSSEHYLANNPGADPLGELRETFIEIASCPE